MNGEIRRIVWYPNAKTELKKIIDYVKKDSSQNAIKIKSEVLQKVSELLKYPEKYPPDKFRLLNLDKKFRAFEIHKIRISYYINTDQIMIIRIRHTKQEPLFY